MPVPAVFTCRHRHNKPQDLNLQQQRCDNLEFHEKNNL